MAVVKLLPGLVALNVSLLHDGATTSFASHLPA